MGAAVMTSTDWGVYINKAIEETYDFDNAGFGYGF